MAELIEMLFELWAWMGPRNHVLDRVQSVQIPMGRVILRGKGVAKYSDFGPIEGYFSETVQDRR